MTAVRKSRIDVVLEPVSGKAIPVMKGETLRISLVEGAQHIEFNCFNLNDHKEYMSAGHMRRESFRAGPERMVWSNPPRYRPMMKIVAMSPSCCSDLLVAGGVSRMLEAQFGIDGLSGFDDTMAQALGEYGLTAEDTHDPLNLWLNTEWDHVGTFVTANSGKAGDAVEMLALMDVLAVPAIAAGANFSLSGNFSYKPVRVEVLEADGASREQAEREWQANTRLKTQRTVDDYKLKTIRTERTLAPAESYQPDYVNFPIELTDIDVLFSSEELQSIWPLRGRMGATDGELVRTLFFHWYVENRKKHGLRLYSPQKLHA